MDLIHLIANDTAFIVSAGMGVSVMIGMVLACLELGRIAEKGNATKHEEDSAGNDKAVTQSPQTAAQDNAGTDSGTDQAA